MYSTQIDSERVGRMINSRWSESLALFRPHAGKNGIHGRCRANCTRLTQHRPKTEVFGAGFFFILICSGAPIGALFS